VEDAQGASPSIPFWRGEAPSRTAELSAEVAGVRLEISQRMSSSYQAVSRQLSAVGWLKVECGVDQRGAEQAAAYVQTGLSVLGTVPTQDTIVAERFFDESGGMQLIIHAPFGGRINRAWGLALRKRFCVTFDFELQAAATDNGLVISLGERHSFPLDSVFSYVHSQSVREVLIQAVLQAPMFMTRWRWNVSRALLLVRFVNGKKVPPQIQRMKAEDLMAAVFPDALACQDNMVGERTRQIPNHPLVNETVRDCLTEAMDLEGLVHILTRIEQGSIRCVAVDTPTPSPFSHEILNANPYAFLDDAPLEERRARAVEMRRTLPSTMAGQVGALDPLAIEAVTRESWPVVRDPDELHDALLTLLWLPESSGQPWSSYFEILVESGRALRLTLKGEHTDVHGWVATEHRERIAQGITSGEEPLLDAMVLGWMESIGPTTVGELADRLHLSAGHIGQAMIRLETSGQVLRGQFRSRSAPSPPSEVGAQSSAPVQEWCHRRLLARIHRLTIGTLRKEVEPVTAAEFMKFLLHWQHAAPGARLHAEAGLLEVVRQLAGFETAASAWESQLLRLRLAKYDPSLLDRLCLSGSVSWGRLTPHPGLWEPLDAARTHRILPTSVAPISLFPREQGEWLLDVFRHTADRTRLDLFSRLGAAAQDVRRTLVARGACFFTDLVQQTGLLASEVEEGLWELIAAGLVTADGFDNLRGLIDPHRRRAEGRERSRRPRHAVGRWSLLRQAVSSEPSAAALDERVARQLLHRYGVVFRDLLVRESLVHSWRDLLIQYRRMEMSGDVRGGRFVSGFVGEQFALPEAVESLRAMRKSGGGVEQEVKVSACDPLNLAGIILPGPRVPALRSNFLVLKDGMIARVVVGRTGETRGHDEGAKSAVWLRGPMNS
jgi:ATP-dependent Lhr-like helicase